MNDPFDPVTGDLLAPYRDAYLRSRLAPVASQAVEAYLKKNPVQTSILLARYHELAAANSNGNGRAFVPPQWVQQQLIFQPTVSGWGPLRRPVVRLALGLFLFLLVASGVQWARNEPLVPAPVAAAVSRVAASASQATQRLVQRFARRPVVAAAPAPRPKPEARKRDVGLPVKPSTPAVPVLAARTPLVASALSDSLPASVSVDDKSLAVPAARPVAVHGRISDAQGRPLPGATVLVQGTPLVTSTDAAGNYELEVPAGAALHVGYGGYADQVVQPAADNTLNVMLQQQPTEGRANRRR